MATFTNYKDELKTCPYNRAHKVSARRYQQHLVRCAKSGLYEPLAECPYNASHRVAPDELQRHMLACADNRQMIRAMVESDSCGQAETATLSRNTINEVLDGEDWDDPKELKGKRYVVPGLEDEEQERKKKKETAEDGDDQEEEKEFRIKSQIELQRLKPHEKKLYYKALLEQTKAKKNE